jgi:hypothetical protein
MIEDQLRTADRGTRRVFSPVRHDSWLVEPCTGQFWDGPSSGADDKQI